MSEILKKTSENKNQLLVMKLNIFLSRYVNYLIFVFLVLLLAIGFLFVIKPKYQSVSDSIKNISSIKEAEYDDLEKKYVKIHGIWSDYQKINKADIEKMRKMLPASGETDDLFREFEMLILKSGLTLNSLEIISEESSKKPDKEDRKAVAKVAGAFDRVGKINIKLSVSGVDYKEFKKLLVAFENNLRLLDIQDLSVSLTAGTASFDMVTYYLKS